MMAGFVGTWSVARDCAPRQTLRVSRISVGGRGVARRGDAHRPAGPVEVSRAVRKHVMSAAGTPGGSHLASPAQLADVVVVGAGIHGLACAVELARRGAVVTVLSRELAESATRAAAGMLAPQSEQIEQGPLLDLCLRSRDMYADWVRMVSALADGTPVDYTAHADFLVPVMRSLNEELQREYSPPLSAGPSSFLSSRSAVQAVDPALCGQDVLGGWWFPTDGKVDNVQLHAALLNAAERLGVRVVHGAHVASLSIASSPLARFRKSSRNSQVARGVLTTAGELYIADHVLITNGSWARSLLAVPVRPLKGQMLSLDPPLSSSAAARSPALRSVVFGPGSYLVPRQDGRIIVGATVEDIGFDVSVTASGIHKLLDTAIRMVPSLGDYQLGKTWSGYRPTTPDLMPILGSVPHYENVTIATGHHRNGILLAPITAQIIADQIIMGKQSSEDLDALLQAFQSDRFTNHPDSVSPGNWKDRFYSSRANAFSKDSTPAPLASSSKVDTMTSATPQAKVMMWHIQEDGTEVPVEYKKPPPALSGDYGDTSPDPNDTEAAHATSGRQQGKVYSSAEGDSVEYVTSVPKRNGVHRPGNSNDAYEDVMQFRGASDKQQRMSEALAKNRSFGNTTGKPGSSVSKEEWEHFDRVYEETMRDANSFLDGISF
ncbi:Bifunctional protein ThiO/ThiG [Porphyridium purpureum]|uniref:Bifunctional protein ThiO/ThiG n=1 Tax=Porphyridium purpureum TaxID=35688 RepID=A0A5J4Z2J0_PORPP|nr:Bifunctional protein ThiO/ThiG [Porphyridium purpureum]|eukprot:POR6184..scf295_1